MFNAGDGVWTPDADIHDALEQLTDGSGNPSGWRYTTANDTVETYDSNGRLQTIQDLHGNVQTLHYNAASQLDRVDANNGDYLTFQYDAQGRIQSMTDRANRTWTYHYDGSDNLASVDNPDGTIRQYHYNESASTSGADLPHALTGITDERGVRYATYEYDADGRAKASYHAGNAGRVDITYDDANHTRTVTDSRGNQTTYGVTTQLGVVLPSQVTGPACGCGGP